MDDLRVISETTQYIVIKIGEEQYGIDIKYIENIVRMQKITRVPKAQPYFKGVINLRGEVVPVMSIRIKMNLPEDVTTNTTRIIILKLEQNAQIGIIVDEVKEVVTLSEEDTERVAYDAKDDTINFINGIGKCNGGLISLLDLNVVVADRETV
ncbi:MAG TPA: chemotaxis protein CheW [Lachnospiraceae bacterium]|jgi:purine-binding chemotaxis protein CheW|nr:chemotaxis protein CheW [Lachnospiraceae bacterium]